jgi:hypothetical protein
MAMKQLPRTILFSFGIALCLFMIASVGSVVLTDGESAFGPSEARTVFMVSFLVSLIFFLGRSLLRGKK